MNTPKPQVENFPEAVSAFITCGEEFFLIKRQSFLKIFPGYHAFAGGKLNRHETKLDALTRELQEELNFTPTSSRFIGSLVTPKHHPYRFLTHFYHIELAEKVVFDIDENEFKSARWIDAKEFSRLFNEGEILMVPPIRELIKSFAQNSKNFMLQIPDPLTFENRCFQIEPFKDFYHLFVKAKTLPPADTTNCFVVDGIIVDPSPRDFEVLENLKKTLSHLKPRLIFISHHHSDHHHLAVDLAQFLRVPVALSAKTYERLVSKMGRDYFRDVSIELIEDQQKIGTWLNHEIKTIALPGHDDGMLGLYSNDLSWMFVSDLFQGFGTVVIGDDEGDMDQYLASLDLVIEMNPQKLLPSHGITVGGVDILHRIKKHRIHREAEIARMLEQGLDENQMLEKIYFDLPPFLKKYALKNILAHLKKIEAK